jgi:SOS regulatory protein LexA
MNPRERIRPVLQFYRHHQRMPSFRELAALWHVKSTNAVHKISVKLIEHGYLTKDRKTGALLLGRGLTQVRLLGNIQAGFPSPAEEELGDTIDLTELLIKNPEATYVLKAQGNSMIEAGIFNGDMVLVKRTSTAKVGDIVIARIDGDGYTMKYLRKRAGKFYLEPANKHFQPIFPTQELKIEAVVIASIRQFHAS